jgi:ATP-binding cassette subfamily B multidrug efflux pump
MSSKPEKPELKRKFSVSESSPMSKRTRLLRESIQTYRKPIFWGLFTLLVVDLTELLPPLLLKDAIDALEGFTQGGWSLTQTQTKMVELAGIYLGLSCIQAVCRYLWRVLLIHSSMNAARDIRRNFASQLFALSSSFFDKRKVGDLMSLATSDVESVRMALGAGLLTLADALFYICTVPVAMFLLSPKLALLSFLTLPVIPLFVLWNEKQVDRRYTLVQARLSRLNALVQEGLGGVRVIKGFAREDAQLERIREAGQAHSQGVLDLARVQSAFGPGLDFLMSMGLVVLIAFGSGWVIEGAVSLGTFVAFQRYIQKMVWPMTAIGFAITHFQKALASTARMNEVLDQKSDIVTDAASVRSAESGLGPRKIAGEIEFCNLSFQYKGSRTPALSGVSFRIEPGMRVALVGAIGSGKSTLLSLLPRLYPIESGMIRIDGFDINRWDLQALRAQLGFVSQDVFLFSEGVLENIAFGLHDRTLSQIRNEIERAQVELSTRVAAVHEEILGFESGYATRLGERGVNLSGGQKQRLTLARAIAREPSILILDDALSAVDVRTEARILSDLKRRPGRNTEIIAAHRISTVKDADRIVVLDRGRVAELGTHERLVASTDPGIYRRFYDQQRLREDLERYLEKMAGEASQGEATLSDGNVEVTP